MDLFYFDTTGLEPSEVDFVVSTLKKSDKRNFVKLPWDSKAKVIVCRQPSTRTQPSQQRRSVRVAADRHASPSGTKRETSQSNSHAPTRTKPPRLQTASRHVQLQQHQWQQQQQRCSDIDNRQPQNVCSTAAGLMPTASRSTAMTSAHFPVYATSVAPSSGVTMHVNEMRSRQHEMIPLVPPPGDETSTPNFAQPMEVYLNYIPHGPGLSMQFTGDMSLTGVGHPAQLMMAPQAPMHGTVGGTRAFPLPMQHFNAPSGTALCGSFPVQPCMPGSDVTQPQGPIFYHCMPPAGSAPHVSGGSPMDMVYSPQGIYHTQPMHLSTFAALPQYPASANSAPPTMLAMSSMPAPGTISTHPGVMHISSLPVSAGNESLPNYMPSLSGVILTTDEAAEGAKETNINSILASSVITVSDVAADSAIVEPAYVGKVQPTWQHSVEPAIFKTVPQPELSVSDVTAVSAVSMPNTAATASCVPADAMVPAARLVFHSRQSSSGSATSDGSQPSEGNRAFAKEGERRNKKKRPADYYLRIEQEQRESMSSRAAVESDVTLHAVAVSQQIDAPQSVIAAMATSTANVLCPPASSDESNIRGPAGTGRQLSAALGREQNTDLPTAHVTTQMSRAVAASAAAVVACSEPAPLASDALISQTSDKPTVVDKSVPASSLPSATAADEASASAPPVSKSASGADMSASLTAGCSPPVPHPPASLSWAQLVQRPANRSSTQQLPQPQHQDPVGPVLGANKAGANAAGSLVVPSRSGAEQPAPPAPAGDLGAILIELELSSRPSPVHPRGFVNKGNWCYANASLQALLACPLFFNFLASLPKDPALCATGASKTPVLDTLVALCNEFTLFNRCLSPTVQQPAAVAPPSQGAKGSATLSAGQQRAASKSKQLLLDLKPGPALEPSFVSSLVQTMWPAGKSSAAFALGKQEDAEEFQSALLNKLHEELVDAVKSSFAIRMASAANASLSASDESLTKAAPGVNPEDLQSSANGDVEWARVGPKNKHVVTRTADLEKSPVTSIFGGKLLSSVTQVGSSRTANIEPFLEVQLDIQSPDVTSVAKALNALAKKETIDGYTCSKTRQEVETHKRLVFEELPRVLILHLKCFVYDKNGLHKISKKIEFSDSIIFSNDLLAFPGKYSGPQRTYKLFAVVHHAGAAATGGHYVTDAFHSGVNCWVRYDDSNISIVPSQSVFEFAAPRMPYLLYYQRADLPSSN